jgi:hypothetical protein
LLNWLTINLSEYDSIKLYSPIWGGNINSTVNAAFEFIPSSKNICRERVSDL